jgi:histidine ammonia-lyase
VNASTPSTVLFDGGDLRLEQIDALAARRAVSVLDDGAPFRRRIDRGAAFLDTLLKEEGVIYGVTTGYGDSCTVAIPEALT